MNKKIYRPFSGKTAALTIIIRLSSSAFFAPSAGSHDNRADYVGGGTWDDVAASGARMRSGENAAMGKF